jgi:hypothetical protein
MVCTERVDQAVGWVVLVVDAWLVAEVAELVEVVPADVEVEDPEVVVVLRVGMVVVADTVVVVVSPPVMAGAATFSGAIGRSLT